VLDTIGNQPGVLESQVDPEQIARPARLTDSEGALIDLIVFSAALTGLGNCLDV
jgi:hypothetical protein